MTISSYDSSSISTLFSSITTSSSSSSSGIYSINLSDYASIKSGSYSKLLKAYYSIDTSSTSSESTKSTKSSSSDSDTASSSTTSSTTYSSTSTSTSKDSSKVLAGIEESSEALTDTAKELYTRSDNKVFKKDASGNYDTDKIYETASDFVENYNSLISSTAKSGTTSISNSVSSLKALTKNNETALSEIGISVDSNNGTLSINADTFKSADVNKIKSLLNGTGSYAYGVATQSSMIDSYAEYESSKSNTYTSSGTYSSNYDIGTILSSLV